MSNVTKLDILLQFEENRHSTSRHVASALNVSHSSIIRVLKENNTHPYKVTPNQELSKYDFDRRTCFREQMMQS